MRILITSIVDLRKTSHNRLHQFIRHLAKNHSITVLSINDWWKSGQTDVGQYQLGVEGMLKNVDIRYFTNRKFNPYLQEVFSVVTLGKVLKEIDYTDFGVHLNYNTLISGYYVARKLRAAGINTVYDIADDLPQMIRTSPQIPSVLRPAGGLIGDIAFKKNIKLAAKVTYINQHLMDAYPAPENKSKLIPNGVDTELFRSYASHQLRQSLGIEADFVVGYVGVLREWVDLEPVFGAVKHLEKEYPNIKILIVGEEGGLNLAKDLAQRYGISDRVIFTGTVPYSQVPRYISCMDVGLIPFKANAVGDGSLPLKLFEYMACAKPVICSRLDGVAQAVGDKVLYASSSGEYQQNLVALMNDRLLRDNMGRTGRQFVEQSCSWAGIGSELEIVLDEAKGAGK